MSDFLNICLIFSWLSGYKFSKNGFIKAIFIYNLYKLATSILIILDFSVLINLFCKAISLLIKYLIILLGVLNPKSIDNFLISSKLSFSKITLNIILSFINLLKRRNYGKNKKNK
jgi:uncharacterized membrane protein YbhN (UPF0104 family)